MQIKVSVLIIDIQIQTIELYTDEAKLQTRLDGILAERGKPGESWHQFRCRMEDRGHYYSVTDHTLEVNEPSPNTDPDPAKVRLTNMINALNHRRH